MKRLATNATVFLGSLAALVVLAIIALAVRPPQPAPPLSVRNEDANGAMALSLWLERMGYDARQVVSNPLRLDGVDALMVLDPLLPYEAWEASLIRQWVQQGHTLIIAARPYRADTLLDAFDVSLNFLPEVAVTLSSASPTLLAPPYENARAEAVYAIETAREDVVVHMASGEAAVLISFPEGAGRVWVSGALRPFTNLGLNDPMTARLVLNLLASSPRGATIGFDEARHGFGEQPETLFAWLVESAPGWGILSALVLTMAFLALRGRRFGRALPLPEERLRREPVEYIRAIANLFRRSGERTEILRHYRNQLKRRLSERYGVDPRLDDAAFLKLLIAREPTLDEAALRSLFVRLSRQRISEEELVRAAADVDDWLQKL